MVLKSDEAYMRLRRFFRLVDFFNTVASCTFAESIDNGSCAAGDRQNITDDQFAIVAAHQIGFFKDIAEFFIDICESPAIIF